MTRTDHVTEGQRPVEELLSRTLHTYARDTTVSPDGLDRIASRRSGRGWVRRAWPGLVVAGATLAIGLGAIVLANRGGDGVMRGPDVLAQPGDVGPIDAWKRVPLGVEHECAEHVRPDCTRLVAAAPLGRGGFLVVGNQGGTPIAYRSDDGRTWGEPVRLPVPGRDARGEGVADAVVEAVMTDGDRYVAVGTLAPNGLEGPAVGSAGVVWVSPDGTRWEPVDLGPLSPAALTDVARTGRGFTATGLLRGGRADVVDLGLWSSRDGRSWSFDGHLGGPLPVSRDGLLPLVGIESGAGTLVYAELLDPDDIRTCGHRGVAVWLGSKDDLPTFANGDDPARPARQTAGPGLEDAVLRPCGGVEVEAQPEAGAASAGTSDTTAWPLRPGVTWDDGAPTLYLHAAEGDSAREPGARRAVAQRVFRPDGERWVAEELPTITEQTAELIGIGVGTDGYRLGVAPQDGSLMSEDERSSLRHHPGDGAGLGLAIVTDDGGGWTWEPYVADDASPTERARMTGALRAGPCEGDPWGYGAVGARAVAVSGGHVLIVGRASDCLVRPAGDGRDVAPFVPALWVGPLP